MSIPSWAIELLGLLVGGLTITITTRNLYIRSKNQQIAQKQKSGDNSTNIQINGNLNIENK